MNNTTHKFNNSQWKILLQLGNLPEPDLSSIATEAAIQPLTHTHTHTHS